MIASIDHLSYSTCRKIYRKGVDYAIATKLGKIDEPTTKALDVGTMAHAMVLGGDPYWIVSPFDNYRTAEARKWRDEQLASKALIISETEFDQAGKIADAIKRHPLAMRLIGKTRHEIELKADIDGVAKMLGYADCISDDRSVIADVKTTAQFDDFKYRIYKNDYDLQAAVYKLFGADDCQYYFIVAESVEPYRVQVFGTSEGFVERGRQKLDQALSEFVQFRERPGDNDLDRLNFNIGETEDLNLVEQLGDWSY